MSKGNMLLGQARGKVGDIVFSRTNGQQVVRARAASVKNPQTEAQMIQRIFMNTVAQAYSKLSPIVDHSFEGVSPGQNSMSMFISTNIKELRSRVLAAIEQRILYKDIFSFTPVSSNFLSANQYLISKGSLPVVPVTILESGQPVMAVSNETGFSYLNILQRYNLKRGDQLTFCQIGLSNGTMVFRYARVILDPVDENGQSMDISTPFIDGRTINAPNPRNQGDFYSTLDVQGNAVMLLFDEEIYAAGIIVSRQAQDGSWMRSTCSMTLVPDEFIDERYRYSLQACLDLLVKGSLSSVSSRYLNNSGVGALPNSAAPTSTFNVSSVSVDGQTIGDSSTSAITIETAGNKTVTVNYTPTDATCTVEVSRTDGGGSPIRFEGSNGVASSSEEFSNTGVTQGYVIKVLNGTDVVWTSAVIHITGM